MRIDLITLLARQSIRHPTRFVACAIEATQLRLTFEGTPWWKTNIRAPGDEQISLVFQGVVSGHLDLSRLESLGNDDADEVLETFSIEANTPGDWTDGTETAIYAQAPLPDAARVFVNLHSHLQRLQSYRGPRDFLNCPHGKLKGFEELTQSSLYLFARAPADIARFLAAELNAQGVPFYTMNASGTFVTKRIVRWMDTVFECEAAFAEFD